MNETEPNKEFAKLSLRHEALKEQVASQIEMYMHLVSTVGPNLKSRYMMLVGQLECQAAKLETDVRRWKRRFALRQQYLNRGEKPDLVAIEAQLDSEFSDYLAKLAASIMEAKNAALRWNEKKMSDTDTNSIRYAYLKAVKKLHPDLNKELSESAKDLWNQIQAAYHKKDWNHLKFLVSLVDGIAAGVPGFAETPDGIKAMREACDQLEAKSREIAKQIADLKANPPFSHETLLADPEKLEHKQNGIKEKIATLKAAVKKYERRWNDGQ